MGIQAFRWLRAPAVVAGITLIWGAGCGGEGARQAEAEADGASLFFPGGSCNEDSQCLPTGVCLNGVCSRQCTTDADCVSALMVCLDWRCVLEEEAHAQSDILSSPLEDTQASDTQSFSGTGDGVSPEPDWIEEDSSELIPQDASTLDLSESGEFSDSQSPPDIHDGSPESDGWGGEADTGSLSPGVCGNGVMDLDEECDGADVGGKTCNTLFFVSDAALECNEDCTLSTLPCPGSHMLLYEPVVNILVTNDLHSVRWHPSGQFALILGSDGELLRYDASTKSLELVAELEGKLNDLDVDPQGAFFLIVGTDSEGGGQVWRVSVTQVGDVVLSFELEIAIETTLSFGTPVAVEAAPWNPEWVFGSRTSTSTSVNYLYLWKDGEGVFETKGFNSGGLTDLMWAYPTAYGSQATVITSDGTFGTNSHSFILATGQVVSNGFGAGFGNPGGAGWRPGGDYGILTGWSSNKVYIFDGGWTKATLPGVGNAASPNAIGWKSDGTRALIVGRPIGTPLRATVIEHRPGASLVHDGEDYVDMSIPSYDESPWNGSGNAHLLGVDWRPESTCDEGLIVGADAGSGSSSTFGKIIRFYDQDDDCTP